MKPCETVGVLCGVLLLVFATAAAPFTELRAAHAIRMGTRQHASVTATAFVHVTVVPMDTERILSDQTVLVVNGRITAIGPSAAVRVPDDARRIDGRGKFLLPGLADMHVHLGFHLAAKTSVAIDTTDALRALLLFADAGVTTVRNMDYRPFGEFPPNFVLHLRAQTAVGTVIGPRIYTSGQWDIGATMSGDVSPPVDTTIPTYVLDRIRQYKAMGYDFIKIHDENLATYRQVVAAANAVGIPFEGHVPPGVPLQDALAAHQRSIEHVMGYNYNDTAQYAALVAATKVAGTWNCPTLMSRPAENVVAMSRFVHALQVGGAALLSGTDYGGWVDERRNSASLPIELQYLVRAGLTPYQALVTSTRNPAVFFGPFNETGTITVGKRADLVLLNANPLADITNVTKVAGVVLNGRWFTHEELQQRIQILAAQTPTAKKSKGWHAP